MITSFGSGTAAFAAGLDALSPLKVLGRGYAIAWNADGHVIKDAAQVKVGSDVRIRLGRGELGATVSVVSEEG